MKKIITLAISFLMTFANAQVQYCYNFNDGTANNSCGTTNNGTYIGPWAGLGADRFGNANYAYYCGASASGGVNCGDISILNSDTSFTIAGWVQMITASNPNSNRYIFNKGGLALYLPQLSNYMTLTIGGQTYSGSTLGIAANYYNNPATNGFRFFAVTRQGSDLKVYTTNDVYPLTYTGAAPSSSGSNFTIGYNTDMKADDILITNVAFSDTQIDSLKNLPNPFTPTPTPFAHVGYSFDKSDARNDLGTNNYGVINGATLTTDRFGNVNKAYNFNGSTNQSINFGDVELLNNTDAYSISMWFSQDQLNVTAAGIWNKSKNNGGTYDDFIQTRFYNQTLYNYDMSNQILIYAAGTPIYSSNSWHHLVLVFDGNSTANKHKTYLDGVLLSTTNTGSFGNTTPNLTGGDLIFGQANSGYFGDLGWNGKIDDIYIANVALSQNQVDSLKNLQDPNIISSNSSIKNSSIKVYPNPASNFINIDIDLENSFETELTITDVIGKVVYQKNHEMSNKIENNLDISSFQNGIYFLQLKNKDAISICKFIKVN